jgi:hypothetical protein
MPDSLAAYSEADAVPSFNYELSVNKRQSVVLDELRVCSSGQNATDWISAAYERFHR